MITHCQEHECLKKCGATVQPIEEAEIFVD